MRILAWAISATITASTAAATSAQTYGSQYPVCLQAFGDKGDYIECHYISLAQCVQSASGRSAQCNINPNYRGSREPLERRDRRPHQRG